jgi:hypothetical protein
MTAMTYNAFLGRDDADPKQLEIFRDPGREQAAELVRYLHEHGDELNRMFDMFEKVLAGEPGYVRPEYLKKARPATIHRRP